MVPVNEVGSEGQPHLLISNLPPISTRARRPSTRQPRIYFGERPTLVRRGRRRQQDEFDYPTGESDTDGSIGTETRWTGTTGIKLDNTLMRLLFAARFRDLDLLISDQVTARQPAALPPLAERPAARGSRRSCASTRIPTSSSTTTGRLVYVQDAFTTSGPVPQRPGRSTRPVST